MSESRIKIKFGEHEFEVEGAEELVKSQFELFRRLVWPKETSEPKPAEPPPFGKMVRVKGRFASLLIPARTIDAILLVLLAQKRFLNKEEVGGAEIMGGLRRSGIRISRADNLLTEHAKVGNLTIEGSGRSRRYRLTDDGIRVAERITRRLSPLLD